MAGRADIKAGGAFIELFVKGQSKALGALSSVAGGLKTVAVAGVAAGAALGGATLGVFSAATKQFIDAGSALKDMSDRTGVSVKHLSELQHAAEQSGASLEDVELALKNMARKGLKAADFDKVAAEIAAIEDPSERAKKAIEVFGKSGTKLLPMIKDLAALRKEANDMGFTMSGRAAEAAERLGDKFGNLWKTVKFGMIALGEALAPALEFAIGHIQEFATKSLKWMQLMAVDWRLGAQIATTGLRLGMLEGIAALSDAVGGAVGNFVATIGTQLLEGDFTEVWSTMLAGLGDLWAGFSEGLVAVFTTSMRAVSTLFDSVMIQISEGILENAERLNVLLGIMSTLVPGSQIPARIALEELFKAGQRKKTKPGEPPSTETDTGAAFRERLDQLDRDAQARTGAAGKAFRDRIGGGPKANRAAIDAAQAELDRLRKEAEAKRKEMEAGMPGAGAGGEGEMPGLGGAGGRSLVTFSANALAQQVGGGGPMEKIAKLSADQYAELKELRKTAYQTLMAIRRGDAMI